MKNILIPIDYSPASRNAADYGLAYAKDTGAKVILMHVFHIPVVVSETPVAIPDFNELEKANQLEMEHYVADLAKKGILPELSTIVRPGFVLDEISDVIKEQQIDLVIMGIKGAGKVAEVIVGSNTTGVMKDLKCPTIAVPANATYKPAKNIVFACDMQKVKNDSAIDQIKQLVAVNNAKLMVLHVVDQKDHASFDKAVSGITLEHIFENTKHSLHFLENDDMVFAINDFVDKHSADLIVMIPKKHSVLHNLFHESNTKKMAFHSHIPLLAVH